MKKIIYVFAGLLAIAIVAYGGYTLIARDSATNSSRESTSSETDVTLDVTGSRNDDNNLPKDSSTKVSMDVTDSSMYEGRILAGTTAPVVDFNKSDYDLAKSSNKLIVLYFYAEWCPICKEEIRNGLYPAFDNLDRDDVIAFRVNFNDSDTDDIETGLAREFGVAYQHTKVFLKNGERVGKWPDSWDSGRYLDEIEKNV